MIVVGKNTILYCGIDYRLPANRQAWSKNVYQHIYSHKICNINIRHNQYVPIYYEQYPMESIASGIDICRYFVR